jgi:hypothetical protein
MTSTFRHRGLPFPRPSIFFFLALGSGFLGGALSRSIDVGPAKALASIVTATQLWTQSGSSQFQFNSWPAQYWELSQGTSSQPNTNSGPLFKISRTEALDPASCNGNKVDNECNAALAVYSVGTPGSGMQTNALFAAAKGSVTGTDVVAASLIGDVTGFGTGIGTGAYIEGRRSTVTGKLVGAEIRAANITDRAGRYFSNSFGDGGALWLTAAAKQPSATIGFGAALGHVAGAQFTTGYAATAGSVSDTTFRDDSSSATSIAVNGRHNTGLDLSGAAITTPIKLVGASILTGIGSPVGRVACAGRCIYLRADGGPNSTLYINETGGGTSGWVAK